MSHQYRQLSSYLMVEYHVSAHMIATASNSTTAKSFLDSGLLCTSPKYYHIWAIALLKVPMTNFFYFLVTFYIRIRCEKRENFSRSDSSSPRFTHLKTEIWLPVGSKNRVKKETGDSWVVTCHREHIDNKTKEKWEIIGTILVNNREIPVYSKSHLSKLYQNLLRWLQQSLQIFYRNYFALALSHMIKWVFRLHATQ